MSRWLVFLMALIALTIAGCSDSGGQSQKLVLTGSSTVAPLAAEIGKRFEQDNADVRVDVQTGGSSRGIADARTGLADIGMASRALKPEEQDLHAYSIARDGVGVIVHRTNPVRRLSDAQVRRIYTDKITNWRAVGGRDAPITVISKAEGRSTLELFLEYFGLESQQLKPAVIIGDNEQGIKTLAGNPNGIAYVSIGTAEYSAEHGVPITLLPMDGVAATTENVRNGTFPLSRPLNLVTREEATGLARKFIDYARGPRAHDLIAKLYFVPLE